jgi:hypothetical protein
MSTYDAEVFILLTLIPLFICGMYTLLESVRTDTQPGDQRANFR